MTQEQNTLAGDASVNDVPLLELRGIGKNFVLGSGVFSRYLKRSRSLVAVADVDLAIRRGSVLGLVGESGSGKSTLAEIAVLLQRPTDGDIVYAGEIVTQVRGKALRDYRQGAQLIFQDSGSALNRRKTIRRVLDEALALRGVPRASRLTESGALLDSVGLAAETLDRYPHQLSGGQRQRVGIARALAMRPELLVADEPVSALDVSLQAQILNLMMDLRRDLNLTMIFISHDLAVVGMLATDLAVMYAGRIVEQGDPRDVLRYAAHPYTQALIAATPTGHKRARNSPVRPKITQRTTTGCSFADRCPAAMAVCRERRPSMIRLSANHRAACHRL